MKLSLRSELPQLLILAAMFVWAGLVWNRIPDEIPIHWDLKGEVDGYGGKFSALLLTPLVATGVYLLMLGLPHVDPGRANYKRFAAAYSVLRMTVFGFLTVCHVAMQFVAFGYSFNMNVVLYLSVGVLMVVLGNLMGKIRPNWFVGVRTPWTLSSKDSWTMTHRLAGRLLVIVGLLSIVTAWSTSWFVFWLNAAALVVAILWTVVYSYLVWRNDPNRIPPAGTSPEESA